VIVFFDHLAAWAFVIGAAAGGFAGVMLGQWLAWLTLRNPIGCVIRAYRELFEDIDYLFATGQLRPGR
jgi:hypothetical protein